MQSFPRNIMFIIPVILCSLANQKAVVLMSLRSYKTKNATGLVLFNQDNFEFSKPILSGFHEKLPFLSQKNVIFHLICSWESCLWAFFGLSFDSTRFFFQTNTDLLYKSFCHVQRVFMHVIPYYM